LSLAAGLRLRQCAEHADEKKGEKAIAILAILGGVLGGAGVIALLRARRSEDWGSLHSGLDGAIRQNKLLSQTGADALSCSDRKISERQIALTLSTSSTSSTSTFST
jgi:hypothetical protein